MIFAQNNGRTTIGKPDKVFGVSSRAKERTETIGKDKVIDATIGALMGEDEKFVVLESVMETIRALKPEDFAKYAPILGLPEYLEAVKKYVFLDEIPEDVYIESCYAPGGTGALRNALSAYTQYGDKAITCDWHWNPYNTIAAEMGRSMVTYPLFNDEMKFNVKGLEKVLGEVFAEQDQTMVIINTPAHNPTGYSLSDDEWKAVIDVFAKYPDKKIALVADIAYIDYAGDAKKYRTFLKTLVGVPENILPLIAFSCSKGLTMYGMRCGALLCMAQTPEVAKEFKDVMSVECRASWSNGNRSAMQVAANIASDEALYEKVVEERKIYMEMLLERGKSFLEEAVKFELKTLPYDAGFFITIPCEKADDVALALEEDNIFTIPMGLGIRVSLAACTIKECKAMPERIVKAIKKVNC